MMICVSTAIESAARARLTPSLGSTLCSKVSMLSWNSRERNLADLGVDAVDVGNQRQQAEQQQQRSCDGIVHRDRRPCGAGDPARGFCLRAFGSLLGIRSQSNPGAAQATAATAASLPRHRAIVVLMIVAHKMKHSMQRQYLDFLGRGMTQPRAHSASRCPPRSRCRRPIRSRTPARAETRARPWAGLCRGIAGSASAVPSCWSPAH